MDRLFLDANILFSAAYSTNAGVSKLWSLSDVKLITSAYAAEEAHRNLTAKQQERLQNLLEEIETINVFPVDRPVKEASELHYKDKPILLAAIEVKATHLITGDFRHFGPYYGKIIEGVLIIPPSKYLRQRS